MIARENKGSGNHGLWLVIRNSKEWYQRDYNSRFKRKREFKLHWSDYPCILRNPEEFGALPDGRFPMYGGPEEVSRSDVIPMAAYRLIRLKKRLFVGDWDKVIQGLCNDMYSSAFGQDDRHFRKWAYNPNGLDPWRRGDPMPRHEARKNTFPLVRCESAGRGVRLKYKVWEHASYAAKERLANAPRWAEKIKRRVKNYQWKLIQRKEALEDQAKRKAFKERVKIKAEIREMKKDIANFNKMIKNLKGVIKNGKPNKKHQEVASNCVGQSDGRQAVR